MTKVLSLFAAATLILGACSTSNQVAQQKNYNDDVYFSEVKATEQHDIVKYTPKSSPRYRSEDLYDDDSYDYAYPYSINPYSNRYNQYYLAPRYSYLTPYNRFNPWYDTYAYGYYNWYSPGISFYIGSNPWMYNNIYSYNYGYPYYGSYYGGIQSYNSYYPGYNYGAYQGGSYNDPNYRARPTLRGAENLSGTNISTVRRDVNGNIMTSPSRGEIYQNNNPGSSTRTTSATSTTARPSRVQQSGNTQQQPQRTQTQQQPQPAVDRTYSPPASSGGGGGGGGGASEDRARPSRAGN